MRKVTTRQMLAIDRRLAAIHEAGHLVLARHFGLRNVEAWIEPTGATGHDMKGWIGHCRFSRVELDRLSAKRMTMVAVAGVTAEDRWKSATSKYYYREGLWEELEEGDFMSPGDWEMTRHAPGRPTRKLCAAIEAVQGLLSGDSPLWKEILREARTLI